MLLSSKQQQEQNEHSSPLQFEELDSLLALYDHLHEADEPLPDRPTIAAVWQQIQQGDSQMVLGGYVADMLVCSCVLVLVPNLTRGCRPYGVIENVVTDRTQRGRGYGRALLRGALALAWERDCYKVMLMTGRLNEATFRFYESAGFRRDAKQAFIAKPTRST